MCRLFVFFLNFEKDLLCRNGHEKLSVIHRLWQGGFEKQDGFFHSTFWNSVKSGEIAMMQYLGGKPSNIDKFDQLKWFCTHTIAYAIHPRLLTDNVTFKQLDCLKSCFDSRQHYDDLMKFSSGGNLPIHLACQTNNSLILKIIIQVAKEKLSQQQFENMLNQIKKDKYWNSTPLMIAIKNHSVDCVEILCRYDCVANGILKYEARYPSYNAFEYACFYNNIDILKILCNVCDLEQLNLKEYLPHMIKITNYGVSKRCLDGKCVEFLNDFSNNPKPKQAAVLINDNGQMIQLICCYNHVLPRANTLTPEKCDICQEKSAGCRSCLKCKTKADVKVFPTIFCETCVKATSIWSSIVHATQNASNNKDLIKNMSNLINRDTVNGVEFRLHVTLLCIGSVLCLHCIFG